MKTITDKTFGKMTYNYQWERQEDVDLWGRHLTLLLAVESETDDDESISTRQCESYLDFKSRIHDFEEEMLVQLVSYCRSELGIDGCNAANFMIYNTASTLFFPLSGGWAVLFDSDYDEENGLAVAVRAGQIEVGAQDIIL